MENEFSHKTETYLELKIYFPAKKPVFHSEPWNCGWITGLTHRNPRMMMKRLTGDVSFELSFLHDDTWGFQGLFNFWQTLKHVTQGFSSPVHILTSESPFEGLLPFLMMETLLCAWEKSQCCSLSKTSRSDWEWWTKGKQLGSAQQSETK